MFEAWRKPVDVEPVLHLTAPPEEDPLLRNEIDPDPLIEEMVARLRDGLSSLHAVDEWGRPLAWRNVVRRALGPRAGRLRDTEQARELAGSKIPVPEEPQDRRVADRRASEEEPEVEAPAVLDEAAPVEAAVEAPVEAEPAVAELPVEPSAETPAAPQATVDVILPAAEAASDIPVEVAGHAILVEEPIEVDDAAVRAVEEEHGLEAPETPAAPVAAAPAVPASVTSVTVTQQPTGATSLFTVSGDQRAVAVSPLGTSQLLSGGSADDTTAAKYDRFLTSLYGEGKQVGADKDRGAGRPGLGNNL